MVLSSTFAVLLIERVWTGQTFDNKIESGQIVKRMLSYNLNKQVYPLFEELLVRCFEVVKFKI